MISKCKVIKSFRIFKKSVKNEDIEPEPIYGIFTEPLILIFNLSDSSLPSPVVSSSNPNPRSPTLGPITERFVVAKSGMNVILECRDSDDNWVYWKKLGGNSFISYILLDLGINDRDYPFRFPAFLTTFSRLQSVLYVYSLDGMFF